MDKNAGDVAKAAVSELGVTYEQFNLPSDAEFQNYVTGVATDVVADNSLRVDPFTLDNRNILRACALEVASRLMRRIFNQFITGILQAEQIQIGPIQITPISNSVLTKQLLDLVDSYHRQAEVALGAAGAQQRRGGIRNWTPSTRITIV